jgi:glucose/arabinose dehydrogenase
MGAGDETGEVRMLRKVTVAVLMAALLGACDGGDPAPSATPSTAPPTTTLATTAPPTTTSSASTSPTATSTCPAQPPLPAGATVVTATVRGGTVTTEHRQWQVKTGSQVRVAVTADVADEVHVHTYDQKAGTTPGCPTAIDFTARIPGTHEVELEDAGKQLFTIKVR